MAYEFVFNLKNPHFDANIGGGKYLKKNWKKAEGLTLPFLPKLLSHQIDSETRLIYVYFFPVSIIILVVRDWISVKCWHIKNAT